MSILAQVPKAALLLDPAENRRYYAAACFGDGALQLDPNNYEAPRLDWLLAQASGSVLDVGCCTGEMVKRLQQQGHWAIGLDPSERHIQTARQRYPDIGFVQGFAEDYAEALGRLFSGRWRYDTVLAGDVLEHVPDDVAFLAILRTLGRKVAMTTPLGRWEGSVEHVREYSEESAKALLETGTGGEVEVIYDRDGKPRWLGLTCPGDD